MEQFFSDYFALLQHLHQDFIAAFDGLPQEALDWIPGADMNSFCVLVVHTTGATRFLIGDVGLGEPSNRDREAEFAAKGWSEAALKERILSTERYVQEALKRLSFADLAAVRQLRTSRRTAGWALLHALDHTSGHLGHAQITRQLWDQQQKGQ